MLPPPSQTRLLTIIAHVDHGKTTLADNLIESNGIISERLAGTLRYLDSDVEEQRRGITMRASAIGLSYCFQNKGGKGKGGGKKNAKSEGDTNNSNSNSNSRVIHLIDSPGHVDFSIEVTSSLLLCDGCLLVIDAVEGLCARTHSLIREAYMHNLVPVLVINKVDRLLLDLGLEVGEAYVRIRELVESVNAVCASMVQASRLVVDGENDESQQDDQGRGSEPQHKASTNESKKSTSTKSTVTTAQKEEEEEESASIWNFDPQKGNVVFASALHGWGFSIPSLARSLFQNKILPIKPVALKQCLFGDFRYNSDNGKVLKWKGGSGASGGGDPMFAEFGLKPIWDVYEGVSDAAAAIGMKSELFSDGRNDGMYQNNVSKNYDSGSIDTSKSNGSKNKKSEMVKIKADTRGMDKVLEAIRVGSTSPYQSNQSNDDSSKNANNSNKASPQTTAELQTLLTQTGSTSESSIVSCILRRYRPLCDAVLDAVCETCPSPQEASEKFRTKVLALRPPNFVGEKNLGPVENDSLASGKTGADGESELLLTEHQQQQLRQFRKIQNAVIHCKPSAENAPTIAHVCKFTSTNRSSVTDSGLPPLPQGDDPSSHTMILGIARVLSGCLKTEDVEYYTFGPKYTGDNLFTSTNKTASNPPRQRIRCYLLMGSSFVKVDSVPAGHICAIYNLEHLQLKTVTLCDWKEGMPLRGFEFGLQPLVKVNVEPVLASDTETLEQGLLKLSLADASVEVTATSKGERLLACLGEIHLERSILDLKTVYCDREIELRISDPITSFCETTTWLDGESDFDAFMDNTEGGKGGISGAGATSSGSALRQAQIPPYCYEEGIAHANKGRCRAILSGRGAAIGVRAVPLSRLVHESLKSKKLVEGSEEDLIVLGHALKCFHDGAESTNAQAVLDKLLKCLCAIDGNGNALLESTGLASGRCAKAVHSSKGEVYVPRKDGQSPDDAENDTPAPNTAISESKEQYLELRQHVKEGLYGYSSSNNSIHDSCDASDESDVAALEIYRQDIRGSVLAGFQLAMRAGPLCEEPVRGVAVILESTEIAVSGGAPLVAGGHFKPAKEITGGMVVAALRSGIRCALITRPARLVEGHLRLTLHSSLAGLGPLHAVLSKRRGKVETDTMVDGTDLIRIRATIPQAESFGLAPELLKKSSGEVTAPELVFSHWEVLDEDPFWIPTTEEEREDYGEILMSGDLSTGLDNNALKYIRMVRSRKGLLVDSSKIVVAAEKQRTLSRKK